MTIDVTKHVVFALASFSIVACHAGTLDRFDMQGDPLPPGAIVRIGTLRWRCHDGIFSMAFSPDGKALATAGYGPIRLWDVSNGKPIRQFGNLREVRSFAFSPDGKTLAASGPPPSKDGLYYPDSEEPNLLTLWDPSTGRRRWQAEGHEGLILSTAFSPDGQTIATGGGTMRPFSRPIENSSELMLWDAASGKRKSVLARHEDVVDSAVFSRDGKTLLSLAGGSVRCWNVATGVGRELFHPGVLLPLPMSMSPDGRIVAVAGKGEHLDLYDAATGKKTLHIRGPEEGFSSTVFSHDGKVVIAASYDGTIRFYDAGNGRQTAYFQADDEGVIDIALSPDGRVLASVDYVSFGQTIHFWDVATQKQILDYPGHEKGINAVAVSSDGKTVATCGDDSIVCLWEASTGRRRSVLRPAGGHVESVSFSPIGSLLAAACFDGSVHVYETATGKQLYKLPGHARVASSVVFTRDGSLLAVGHWGGTVQLWRIPSGELMRTFTLDGNANYRDVYSIALSPDGKLLAASGWEPVVRVWNVADGRQLLKLDGEEHFVKSVAFSPDGSTLAAGGQSETIHLWDMPGGKLRRALKGPSAISTIAFSPDGKVLASGGVDGAVRLWDLTTGKTLASLDGHRHGVTSVRFSDDGDILVSGSSDATALVWDWKTARQKVEIAVGQPVLNRGFQPLNRLA